jgi:hypothetical protein
MSKLLKYSGIVQKWRGGFFAGTVAPASSMLWRNIFVCVTWLKAVLRLAKFRRPSSIDAVL